LSFVEENRKGERVGGLMGWWVDGLMWEGSFAFE
jgi:hypothetical protein